VGLKGDKMRMVIGTFEGYEKESKELLAFIMTNIKCAIFFDEKMQLARTARSRNRFKKMAINADELNRMALSLLRFGMPRIEEDYRPATMKVFNDDQRIREIMENGFRNYKALNILD
jgi:hypothetical protein